MKRILICAALLIGCGGGGGGSGSGGLSFAGEWSGFLEQQFAVCVANDLGDASFTFTVNQNGSTVVLDSSTGSTFEGTADDDLLIVRKSQQSDCSGSPGEVSTEIQLVRNEGGAIGSNEATGIVDISSTCGATTINCLWIGEMRRG